MAWIIGITIGDGEQPLTTGFYGCTPPVPRAGTIAKWTILSTDPAFTTGSIQMDVYKKNYASGYPPLTANSIVASAPPFVTSGINNQQSGPTSWTTTVLEGDVFGFQITTVTDFTRVTFGMMVI